MNRFLRTASTPRLLAAIIGAVTAVAAGTAIALAESGGGPVPKPARLADAVHEALSAPQLQGITARITFTNHLIDASDLQGTDPLLQGASGRLWLSPPTHQLRLELQSDNGDAQVLVDNRAFTVYDPASNTAYEGTLPADAKDTARPRTQSVPSIAEIQRDINRLVRHVNLSGAIPSDVAGQPTYTVRVTPKHDGGLLGAAELAVDAAKGVPLRFGIYASGAGSPVLELTATSISYGAVDRSVFAFTPPPGTKIVKVATPASQSTAGAARAQKRHGARRAEVTGVAAVARRLPFALVAPRTLRNVGVPRQSVTLLDWDHTPAALVTYGKDLGGVAVIEQAARPQSTQSQSQSQGGDRAGLSLPTVNINGTTAQELDTALGTMIRFTRGGVTYTVIGSVPPAAAELAAKGL